MGRQSNLAWVPTPEACWVSGVVLGADRGCSREKIVGEGIVGEGIVGEGIVSEGAE